MFSARSPLPLKTQDFFQLSGCFAGDFHFVDAAQTRLFLHDLSQISLIFCMKQSFS